MDRESIHKNRERWLFLWVIVLSLVIHGLYFNRGWVHNDEGYFLSPVLAIEQGALPHLDFQTNHTGLLFYWHALLFQVFGHSILATRVGWLITSVLQSLLQFWIARRLLPTTWVLPAMLCLMATGPIGYVTSNPNWVGIFLLHGVLVLLMLWGEDRRRRWLVASGVLLGITLLMKQSLGIFGLCAALLCLNFRYALEQAEDKPGEKFNLMPVLVVLVLTGVFLHQPAMFLSNFLLYTGPLILLMIVLWRLPGTANIWYAAQEFALWAGFLSVCSIVMILICVGHGPAAITMILKDTFVDIPRLASMTFGEGLSSLDRLLWIAPSFLLAFVPSVAGYASAVWCVLMWLRTLTNCLVIGLLLLKKEILNEKPLPWRYGFFCLLTFSVCSLWVTYPVGVLIYQLYGMSFAILLLFAGVSLSKRPVGVIHGVAVGWLIVGAFCFVAGKGIVSDMRQGASVNVFTDYTQELSGVRVAPQEAQKYQALLAQIRNATDPGRRDDLLVLPDTPEVYFLSNKINPLPYYYLFPQQYAEATRKIEGLLERRSIEMVVVPTPLYDNCANMLEAVQDHCRLIKSLSGFDVYQCR